MKFESKGCGGLSRLSANPLFSLLARTIFCAHINRSAKCNVKGYIRSRTSKKREEDEKKTR